MSIDDPVDGIASPPSNAGDERRLSSLPVRIVQTFFSPDVLTEGLARNPAWGAALVLGAVLVLGQTLLIPPEVWDAMFQENLAVRGQEMPEGFAAGSTFMRLSTVAFGTLGYFIITFLFAGLVTVVFAFVMGDEGRYRQYLAVLGHAWLIPAVTGFLLLPLKISQENPQFTLNLGAFLFFLPEGYLTKVGTMLDLSQLWAWLVVAQGAHAIDGRRSFTSAAVILMVVFLGMALLFALIPGVG